MKTYKRTYRIIGLLGAILGVILISFLHLIIREKPDVSNIYLIYLLSLVSITIMGLYYKYLMVINRLKIFYSIVFHSINSSIGDLGVTATNEKHNKKFNTLKLSVDKLEEMEVEGSRS